MLVDTSLTDMKLSSMLKYCCVTGIGLMAKDLSSLHKVNLGVMVSPLPTKNKRYS